MSKAAAASSREETSNTGKRVAQTVAGGTLLALGLRRRTWPGYAAALAGGWLAYRGIRGDDRPEISLVSLEDVESSAQAVDVQRTMRIQAPAEQVRAFFEEASNLDRVLDGAGSVQAVDETRQRGMLETPLGYALAWEMQRQTSDEDGEIVWSSTGPSDLSMGIELRAAPGEQGTEATMTMRLHPPGGSIGRALFDRLEVVPNALVGRMLRRSKRLVETGEAPPLSGSP